VNKITGRKTSKTHFFPRVLSGGQRGQASAPFELFVAVIIMTFVIVVGYQVLDRVNTEVCLSNVEREMTKFKSAIEDTVARKSSNSFSFHPEGSCYSSKETVMQIVRENNSRVCADRCGYPSDDCRILLFSNPTVAGALKQKCLNLPQYTYFETSCDTGTELAGYNAINPTVDGTLPSGSYVIRNISPAGQAYPQICVYYKP